MNTPAHLDDLGRAHCRFYWDRFAQQRTLKRDSLVNSGEKRKMNPWCHVLYLENHNYPAGTTFF